MASRWTTLDRTTQLWVRATGTKVRFADSPWLAGPVGDADRIGHAWLDREARRLGGEVRPGGGLLVSMDALGGAGFRPDLVAPAVREFYERTRGWRLDVWSEWCAAAWPFGWLISALFARRLDQLSLPLRPLDTARGVDSQVLVVADAEGQQLGAAWLRTLRSTGETVYSGWYGTALLPGHHRPSVRVVFPLPNGSVTVFLRPENGPAGALRLISPVGPLGDDGAYLVVADHHHREGWVRRVPLAEEFSIYVDDEGVLRTDHTLNLWRLPVIRLHYRLERRHGAPGRT